MSATTLSRTQSNPHVHALEQVMAKAERPVEWLVIAHNDARMLAALSSALTGESAAILELSEDTWDFEGKELSETIEWAIEQGDIEHLVLAGHSHASGSQSRASLPAYDTKDGGQDGHNRLLAGAQGRNAQNSDVQAKLAAQMEQMSDIPAVQERCSRDELAVYALLYRADLGVFLAYESDEGRCRPLVA